MNTDDLTLKLGTLLHDGKYMFMIVDKYHDPHFMIDRYTIIWLQTGERICGWDGDGIVNNFEVIA
tara:strand:+ start:862 stop:1056 length:195 start_codon:yes stop_codon:yes gene_type:complete